MAGLVCGAPACGQPAVVQWSRRPTPDELDAIVGVEQDKRNEAVLLADPALPVPDFGPLPSSTMTTITLYACAGHAVSLDAASLVHTSACAAPPVCTCTPEQVVTTDPVLTTPVVLPADWS